MKFLDHLEEWLIAFLIGAATLIIFVAVLHRYAAGLADPGRAGLAARDQLSLGAGAVHLHVRLDGQVRRRLRRAHRHPRRRRRADQPAARGAAARRTCSSACSPARCSPASSARWARTSSGRSATPTRSRPTSSCRLWIVYLCIPLRLLPDVLPLPAGRLVLLPDRRAAARTTWPTSRASTRLDGRVRGRPTCTRPTSRGAAP